MRIEKNVFQTNGDKSRNGELPKTEIKKFSRDLNTWINFKDSFEDNVGCSNCYQTLKNLCTDYLVNDLLHPVSDMKKANSNYKKTLEMLRNDLELHRKPYLLA